MTPTFKLDNRPNKKKYHCPACGQKTFTYYIHAGTQVPLDESTGICDRINNCCYHYTPKQFLLDNAGNPATEVNHTSFISRNYFEMSFQGFNPNNNCFYKFLTDNFGEQVAENTCKRYHIGNSSHWKGANVFWQVDINQKVRTGKVMLYDPHTGKRVKKPFNHITWVHHLLQKKYLLQNFSFQQCLFGEHLLKYETGNPVAIVESEKTAVICHVFMPEYIWLASGQANGLNVERCRVLKGRKVVLFPDLKQYDNWRGKTQDLRVSIGLNITISDKIEKLANPNELKEGYDLADYLIESWSRNS